MMFVALSLPLEVLGCRRTTCSRVSLITLSSSSSERASAISPSSFTTLFSHFLSSSFKLLLLSVCGKLELCQNRSSGGDRHIIYSSSCFGFVANLHRESSNTVNFKAPTWLPGLADHFYRVFGRFRGEKKQSVKSYYTDNNYLCGEFQMTLSPSFPVFPGRELGALRRRDVTSREKKRGEEE